VKLKTQIRDNETLILAYVPSVFQAGTKMNLTIESLTKGCGGWSASVPVKYSDRGEVELSNDRDRKVSYRDVNSSRPNVFQIPTRD